MTVSFGILALLQAKPGKGDQLAGRGFSNARARRELGWTPSYRSWRQGFIDGLS